MKRGSKYLFAALCALAIVFWLFGSTASGENITITGTVNENYQIVADTGQIYEVAETEKGNEMVLNFVAKQVKATGVVEESDGVKVTTIPSYEVIGE